jgi:hypothetical protein
MLLSGGNVSSQYEQHQSTVLLKDSFYLNKKYLLTHLLDISPCPEMVMVMKWSCVTETVIIGVNYY